MRSTISRTGFVSLLSALVLTVSVMAQAQQQNRDQFFMVPTADNEIKIMGYNVENLFNAVHNPGKQDWTYMPRGSQGKINCKQNPSKNRVQECLETDWTTQKLQIRFQQIARVLAGQGSKPDVFGIAEIESEDVVAALGQFLGYDGYVFFDGPDERGIDQAILFSRRKLDLLKWDSVPASMNGQRPTRNILRAIFGIRDSKNKDVLAVMVNHWPSQGNPTPYRTFVAQQHMKAVDQIVAAYGPKAHIVSLGDFNTLEKERPNAIYDYLLNPKWPNSMVELQNLFQQTMGQMARLMPPATSYFPPDQQWSHLDRILVSKNFFDKQGLEAILESFRIVSPSFMLWKPNPQAPYGVPNRFNQRGGQTLHNMGFSDHLPVEFKFRYVN